MLQDSMAVAVREGTAYEVEFRAIWPDGSLVWMAGRARLIYGKAGEPTGVLGVTLDISDRKRLEARAGAETAGRMKAEAAIAEHRLRVLKATMRTVQDIVMNSFQGLQLIRFQAEGVLPESSIELFDEIIDDASRKLRALNDLEVTPERQMEMGVGIDYDSGPPKVM